MVEWNPLLNGLKLPIGSVYINALSLHFAYCFLNFSLVLALSLDGLDYNENHSEEQSDPV